LNGRSVANQEAHVVSELIVPAVFANRGDAEVAIAALRRYGVAERDIGVAVPQPGRHQHREPSDSEVVAAAGQGGATGAMVGSIGGVGLLALTAGETLAFGAGGLLAAGMGGLLWGFVIGGLLGVITRVRRCPEEDRWCEVPIDSSDVLVAARVQDWSHEPEIAALMTAAGARCVVDRLDLDRTWSELEVEHPSGQLAPVAPGQASGRE
jgi:hypothetical protein